MREIKFRAWDETNKVMEYNININQGKAVKQGYQWFNTENTVHDSELMQYTGLKDRNGTEIYEGDICHIWIGGHKQGTSYVVEDMRKLYLDLNRDDSYYCIGEIEVIGNIYEHSHLLESDE